MSGTDLVLYHGTSVILADAIEKDGLKCSEQGCLGRGLYLACLDKATNFALDAPLRQKGEGAVVFKVSAKVTNPKYINGDDRSGQWKREGYDSICTSSTSFSRREEWCIADPSQCTLLAKAIIYYGRRSVTEADFEPITKKDSDVKRPTCPGRSNWGKNHPAEDGERVQCPYCKEYRCSNCIPVHLIHCRGWSLARMVAPPNKNPRN